MVKWERIDGNKVVMEIEVPEPVVEQELDKAYRKIVKQVSIPGFRKGKVPRAVLEKRFGVGVLFEEALDVLLPEAYQKAVEETGVEPIDRPDVDLVQVEKGKPLIFKATVEVLPEVKLGEYRGIEVELEVNEIDDSQVEARLEQLRKQHVKLNALEEGTVENGDVVVIDFTGFLDGETSKELQSEGYSLEIGSGTFVPGFEEGLVGAALGEEKEINVVFPEDYRAEKLAGKNVTFKVKVREIKRKEYPELNDDFAKEVSEFETLAELKEDIANKLKKQEEDRQRIELENKVIEAAVALSEVEAPKPMVEREIDRMLDEMEQYMQMQGLTMEKFLELTNRKMEDMRAERREEAEARVKGNLVLDAIVKKEGITVSDEEIDERIRKFADSYKQDFEKVKEYFVAQGQVKVLEEEIRIRKAIDLLVDNAVVTRKPAAKTAEDGGQESEKE